MSAAAYAAGTVLGSAHSGRAAEFRALAPGFLGMDGRRGGVRILLCSGFPNSAEWNAGRPPRAVTARVEKILSRLLRRKANRFSGTRIGDSRLRRLQTCTANGS